MANQDMCYLSLYFENNLKNANAKPEARHNRAQLCFAPVASFTMCSSAFSDLLFVVFSNDINVCPQQQQQKNQCKAVCHPHACL